MKINKTVKYIFIAMILFCIGMAVYSAVMQYNCESVRNNIYSNGKCYKAMIEMEN